MPVSTRIIKRRIKSISNTKKITKAMELVSASKMRRAVNATLGTRPYANLGWETVGELAKVTDAAHHALLRQPEKMERALVVLVSSDRGLCGGFNAQMAKRVIEFVRLNSVSWRNDGVRMASKHDRQSDAITTPKNAIKIDFLTVGKKGTDLARRLGWNIVATFNNLSNNPRITDVRPVAQLAITDFVAGKYDAVYLAYTDFISSIRQVPNVKQLLPLTKEVVAGGIHNPPQPSLTLREGDRSVPPLRVRGGEEGLRSANYSYSYLFEPTPAEVLDGMLPRLVEVQVYQAILESSASEHSARMVAMKNASDAARDMIDDLTFTFNQARQATITREIAEISAGKAALE
ncbi:F0F1 ATP synthase subunit gamma [Candidatus Uhrbacteria bacterium]|nr:F0F1 ATP synthase subunit gamma [Candidatus Uhrbacteria bacterium]